MKILEKAFDEVCEENENEGSEKLGSNSEIHEEALAKKL